MSRDEVARPLHFEELRERFDRAHLLYEEYRAARAELERDVQLLRLRTAYLESLLAATASRAPVEAPPAAPVGASPTPPVEATPIAPVQAGPPRRIRRVGPAGPAVEPPAAWACVRADTDAPAAPDRPAAAGTRESAAAALGPRTPGEPARPGGRFFRVVAVLGVAVVLAGGATARLTNGNLAATGAGAALAGTVFEGTIKPAQQFTIASPATTVVQRVLVRAGDRVDAGDALIVLDDRDASAALRGAELELRAAETRVATVRTRLSLLEQTPGDELALASGRLSTVQRQVEQVPVRQWRDSPERAAAVHEQAKRRLDRIRRLHEQQLVATQELEEAEVAVRVAANDLENARRAASAGESLQGAQHEQAELQWKLARAEREQQRTAARSDLTLAQVRRDEAALGVEAARARVEACTIRATRRGVVVEMAARPGDQVGGGATLVRLASLDALLVEVHVAPALVNALRRGQPATIALPGAPVRQTTGAVMAISPMPNAAGHHVVEIRFENPDAHLLAGQPAQVRFELAR